MRLSGVSKGVRHEKASDRRKRRVVVEKDFQYRFTLKICLIGGVMLVAYGGLVLYMIRISYEALRDNALLLMPDMVTSLDREQRMLGLSLVAVLVLLVAFLFGLGLLLTQKIAGPLLQLQKRLLDFSDGRRGLRMRFRKNDEFQIIASTFNNAMESYERRQEDLWQQLQDIGKDAPDATRAKIDELLQRQKNPVLKPVV